MGNPASDLENRIEERFGLLPNFFRLASETPDIIEKLWGFAQAAYLHNPLPSVFKERLSSTCRAFAQSAAALLVALAFWWDLQRKEAERETRFVELGRYLCEVRAGQYWRMEDLHSFDEFLERRFPDSRRTAYYLMSIHEHLPPQIRRELKQVGWTKAAELTKVARSDGKDFDCAAWMHRARSMPRDEFKREVDKHLTGKDTEPTEIVYFKLYKSQVPVIEQAIETAGLLLGTDKSRGYCLEMICADFLAGANLQNGSSEVLLQSILSLLKFLPGDKKRAFVDHAGKGHAENPTEAA